MNRFHIALCLALLCHGLLFALPWQRTFAPCPLPVRQTTPPMSINLQALPIQNQPAKKTSSPNPSQGHEKKKIMKKHLPKKLSIPTPRVHPPKNPFKQNKKLKVSQKTVPPRPNILSPEIKKRSQEKNAPPKQRPTKTKADSTPGSQTPKKDPIQKNQQSAAVASPQTNLILAYPDYAFNPPPPYPMLARKRGYQGKVLLRVYVLKSGLAGKVEIVRSSGFALLDKVALRSVQGWKFIPGRRGKKNVPMWITVPIDFRLHQQP